VDVMAQHQQNQISASGDMNANIAHARRAAGAAEMHGAALLQARVRINAMRARIGSSCHGNRIRSTNASSLIASAQALRSAKKQAA